LGLTINKRHAWTVRASLAHTVQVPLQELVTTNFEALFDDLGSVLVHAVLCTETEDVINGTTTVSGRTMFADMLDALVAELTMGDDIDAGKHLVDAGTLSSFSTN